MYTAKQEDKEFAKRVWETQILQMVYNPQDLREAHRRLFGYDAATPQQARTRLNAHFRYQAVDVTETADILTPSIVGESSHAENSETDNQSHSEDLQPDEMPELERLEGLYELAEDSNEKRSLKQKINKLKKQNDKATSKESQEGTSSQD